MKDKKNREVKNKKLLYTFYSVATALVMVGLVNLFYDFSGIIDYILYLIYGGIFLNKCIKEDI